MYFPPLSIRISRYWYCNIYEY